MLDGVRILAVHHDSGRNGATLLFQTVLEGLARDHGAVITSSFPREGPLVDRARALGLVHVREQPPSRLRRLTERLPRRQQRTPATARHDLVFANSAASLRDVEAMLDDDAPPLAVYVHESRYLLRDVVDFSAAQRMLRRADVIFAVSPQVEATLEELVEPSARIVIASGFVPARSSGDVSRELPAVAKRAIAEATHVVGAIGTMSWYKGADLFVAIAQRIRQLTPDLDVRFVWIGEEWRAEIRHQLAHDVKLAGLDDLVVFPGGVDDPTRFLQSLTLLLLPSREDSWPLVMLEAAAEGVPIVCFHGAGGAQHFLAAGGGTAVPYLDVEAMARAAVRYLSDRELRARDSEVIRGLSTSVNAEEQIAKIGMELAAVIASRSAR
jgi:glycosyltransferase involved in cell wall biosynthesis